MEPVGTFTKADDCVFQLTRQGWERREEFSAPRVAFLPPPSPGAFPGHSHGSSGVFPAALNRFRMADAGCLRVLMRNDLVEPVPQEILRPFLADSRPVYPGHQIGVEQSGIGVDLIPNNAAAGSVLRKERAPLTPLIGVGTTDLMIRLSLVIMMRQHREKRRGQATRRGAPPDLGLQPPARSGGFW